VLGVEYNMAVLRVKSLKEEDGIVKNLICDQLSRIIIQLIYEMIQLVFELAFKKRNSP